MKTTLGDVQHLIACVNQPPQRQIVVRLPNGSLARIESAQEVFDYATGVSTVEITLVPKLVDRRDLRQ